jgi:hypothetical protein
MLPTVSITAIVHNIHESGRLHDTSTPHALALRWHECGCEHCMTFVAHAGTLNIAGAEGRLGILFYPRGLCLKWRTPLLYSATMWPFPRSLYL